MTMGVRRNILLAIFQQSHYEPALFYAWLRRHPVPEDWDKFSHQVSAVWSLKARLLAVLARIIGLGRSDSIPAVLITAHGFIIPLEALAARWIGWRARAKCSRITFRAIIGITGSFGKTTTKEFVAHILAGTYRVQKTPDNINTFFGIVRWIMAKSDLCDDDILIVEMGAYHEGDIAAACRIVRPTIAVITGLNEAHLERFGSLDATARTKTELIGALPSGGIVFWNQSSPILNEYILAHRGQWQGKTLVPYGGGGEDGAQEPDITDNSRFFHNDGIDAARAISAQLGITPDVFEKRAHTFHPIARRFAVSRAPGDRLVIDDSYNITLDGIRAACRLLGSIPRRKIGVFACIPEAGVGAERVNKELGQMIGGVFDSIL
ncbi:MAG: Mur ligase family protein, partial [Candidatus Sungiibacteriota bacterium]